MAVNRGKQFEEVIRVMFSTTPKTSIIRLPDPTMGYLGYRNICDFIVYHYPFQYLIECKTVHGNTFPFSNVTENQYEGMLYESDTPGIIAGVLVWFVDKDVTKWIPIRGLQQLKAVGDKSIRYDKNYGTINNPLRTFDLVGKKKRIFFDYDMEKFFEEFTNYGI